MKYLFRKIQRYVGVALVNLFALEPFLFVRCLQRIILKYLLRVKVSQRLFIDDHFDCLFPENITFGDGVSLGHYNKIWAFCPVTIGDFTQTALGVTIIAGGHDTQDFAPRSDLPVVVGPGCWIGANVTILGGVCIGRGCIIAAGAVVTSNIDEFLIVGGVPAKTIKKRIVSDPIIHPFGEYSIHNLSIQEWQ